MLSVWGLACRVLRLRFVVPTVTILLLALGVAGPAFATTYVVTSLADSGIGTLRAALANASGVDIIQFKVAGTIQLASGLTIGANVNIAGPGASSLTISGGGGGGFPVFTVNPGVVATISGVTITDGGGFGGGGIFNNNGTLTVSNSTLSGNTASNGGGGIYNQYADFILTNSIVSGNTDSGTDGDINDYDGSYSGTGNYVGQGDP